jgi:hypothetical protein
MSVAASNIVEICFIEIPSVWRDVIVDAMYTCGRRVCTASLCGIDGDVYGRRKVVPPTS